MKISELKINPNNPQSFTDLSKLENSIREFPKMMELRPMVYDPATHYILGGNKRLICLINLGFEEIPDSWVRSADKLTEDEKKRFIIADNVGFGEWDFEKLKEWDSEDLEDWGLNVEKTDLLEKKEIQTINPYNKSHVLISFNPNDYSKIQDLIEKLYSIDSIEIEQSAN